MMRRAPRTCSRHTRLWPYTTGFGCISDEMVGVGSMLINAESSLLTVLRVGGMCSDNACFASVFLDVFIS